MVKAEIQIIVATHKPFAMPCDEMYLPLSVGAAEREPAGYVPDNIGDNISDQNHIYSELTGLYWAWKNLDAKYIGLVHYRRYFKEPHPERWRQPEAISEASAAGERILHNLEPIPQLLQSNSQPILQRYSQMTQLGNPRMMQSEKLQSMSQRNTPDTAMEIGAEAFQWQEIADAGLPDADFLGRNGFPSERISGGIPDVNNIRWKSYGQDYSKQLARVLTYESLQPLLEETDIILPHRRNYRIETLYSHYAHTHCGEHLDATREIIAQRCPEYVSAFDAVMQRTSAHMFNMMIMRRDRLDEYCSWLFPILAELVERIDASGYDAYQARFPGRVSELMLDVWLAKCGYCYCELPLLMIGPKHWGKKIVSFLGAKFLGRQYRESY